MKKYEYTELYNPSNSTVKFIDEINEYAKEGWKLVSYSYSDSGHEHCLMERESRAPKKTL